jgi:hypothetical protein
MREAVETFLRGVEERGVLFAAWEIVPLTPAQRHRLAHIEGSQCDSTARDEIGRIRARVKRMDIGVPMYEFYRFGLDEPANPTVPDAVDRIILEAFDRAEGETR